MPKEESIMAERCHFNNRFQNIRPNCIENGETFSELYTGVPV